MNEPDFYIPSTLPEIIAAQQETAALEAKLLQEACAIYEATRKAGAPAAPLTEHDKLVGRFLSPYLNGETPAHLLEAQISRDSEIRAHRDALKIVQRELAKRREALTYVEAEKFVARTDKEWRAICREVVLAGERLAALEESARQFLKPIEGISIRIAMGSTIASGLSLLGRGDAMKEWREAAISENIVSEADVRKARKL